MRKDWLAEFVPGTYLDQGVSHISIKDFVNKELILFSMADNIRSIPSLVDGLKPGQRKVLFSCFKKNLKQEIKVAQLVGYVSEQSAYHHGEQSLCSTIVNLAQDFVGSNNINLLLPLGSFGSRLQGGKDSASPRYIYTSLNPLTRLIFHELDDPLLNFLNEDNLQIEPEYYVPILPMVLVNGADGIGTGWSTCIPNYNPIDIINNLRKMMNNEDMSEMVPYYRNFRGEITYSRSRGGTTGNGDNTGVSRDDNATGGNKFVIEGVYEQVNENTIQIFELPVRTWTQTYKEYLESLLQSGTIKDYKEYHTEKTVDFLITQIKQFPLKLSTQLTTSNMICFDSNGKIKRYNSPLDIIREFYYLRLNYYEKRKEHRLAALKLELSKLDNRVRFIKDVTNDRLIINKRLSKDIIEDLVRMSYEPFDNFEYLLGMKISALTKEKIEKLIQEYNEKKREYDELFGKSIKELWNEDLNKFEIEYLKVVEQERVEYDSELNKKIKKTGSKFKISKKSEESVKVSKTKAGEQSGKESTVKKIKTTKQSDTNKDNNKSGTKKKDNTNTNKNSSKNDTSKSKKVENAKSSDKPKDNDKSENKPSGKVASLDSFIVVETSSSDEEAPWNKYKV